MTLAEKIEAEMNIDNPKPLTEEEKQQLKHFNETDTDKEFWNLPYKTKPAEQNNKPRNGNKTFTNKYYPENSLDEEAYYKGYNNQPFKPYDERQKTYYINGKLHRENNMSYNPTIGAGREIPNCKEAEKSIYRKTMHLTLTLEEAKAGKTAEQKLNEFWEEELNDNPF